MIAYAAPALPLAALQLPFYVMLPTFYVEDIGLSLATVGTILIFVRLFDAANDPVLGYAADRIRLGFGRRRLFVAVFAPLTAIAGYFVMTPPDLATWVYFCFWSLLLSLAWSGMLIPLSAWGAELAPDYRGRTRIAAGREIATVCGILIAVTTPVLVEAVGAADRRTGLAVLAILIAVMIPVLSWIAVAFVPEPPDRSRDHVSLRLGLSFVIANRPFRGLITAYFINGFANGLPATLFLLFVGFRLDWNGAEGPLLLLYFFCGICGVPIWLWLSKRLNKHRAWSIAMAISCLAFASVSMLTPDSRLAFIPIVIITGLTLAADLTLPAAIQADVIDVDTATSGEQRSGLYFAAWGMVTKLSLALASGLAFLILGFVGLDPGAEIQPPEALLGLTLLYGSVPTVLKIGAVAIMWRFPLDEAAQIKLRLQIDKTRTTAAAGRS